MLFHWPHPHIQIEILLPIHLAVYINVKHRLLLRNVALGQAP